MYPKYFSKRALTRAILLSTVAFLATPALAGGFVNLGPSPEIGNTGNAYDTYSGAVNAIVTDPADANTMYIGAVNGGVWVTHDGGKTWTVLTDKQLSLSIGSLSADPTDATHKTLIAGTGLSSNGFVAAGGAAYASSGGLRTGLLYTTDGGTTWSLLGATTFAGQSVGSVAVRGNTIIAGTYEESSNAPSQTTGGLYRSTDGGATFTSISGTGGLPSGPITSIVGDPASTTKLYAAVTAPDGTGTGKNSTSIYVSTDTGATWSQVFAAANAGGVINTTDQTKIQLATGPGGALAAGIVDVATGKLTGLFLSKNSGATWQTLPVPTVNPGGQGNTNFAIAVDPNNTNYVYVTGDALQTTPYTLIAYRVDAGTSTFTSITDAHTGNNSTVHPDSRALAFDANGQLIVSTDGGVYMRSQPQSDTGVWSQLNGNLSAIEAYQVAYGANSHLVGVAAQDNSAMIETSAGSVKYNEITGGDGTVATVNDKTLTGKSVYYLSVQNLAGLTRVTVDSAGKTVATDTVNLSITPNGNFYTPFVLNKIDPSLIAIGGDNVYLTQDTLTGANAPGNNPTLTLTNLGGDGNKVSAIAYGTQDNTNALIAGIGGGIWMSTSTGGGIHKLAAYTGVLPTTLVFDNRTQDRFFSADATDLWGTTDQGATFQKLTANLPTGFIRPTSADFISNNGVNALLVGGLGNSTSATSPIAVADSSATGVLSGWRFFGTGMPNVLVSQLTYNPAADVLAVATFGRGAWLLYDVTSYFSQASVLQFGLANNDSTPDASLLTGSRPLKKYGTGTLMITGAGSYTGGTTINAGTLQLGNGGTAGSILGDVVDNGLFAINRSDAYTFAGAISGTGQFLQAGGGTTTLTGANSFTGNTTISAGMLQLGSGGTSGSLTGNVINNGLFSVNRSDAYTYAGVISGAGGFIQAGAGNTILTGTNTYTGATNINAGTLSVNGSITSSSSVSVANGGTLGGTGTVSGTSVASGGTLAPGNSVGTLHISGNLVLAAGSTYLSELTPSASDQTLVTGTATINGHLVLAPLAGIYTGGKVYTLINSTGALTGMFSDVVFNGTFGGYMPSVSYDANNAFVTLNTMGQIAWSSNPGSADWNTGSNWTTHSVPTANDTALFNTTTQPVINIQKANTQVAALQFNAGAPAYVFNISGTAAGASSLALGGAGVIDQSSNAPSFVVSGVTGNTGTLQFNNAASTGDATITTNAFGTTVFTGLSDAGSANLVTGDGGTVDISGLATAGMSAGSIAGSGAFVLGAKALTAGGLNTSTTVSGIISGIGGQLNKTGTGTLILSGENTYSGGTTIAAGTLQIGDGNKSGSIIGNVANNAQLTFNRSDTLTLDGVISGTGAVAQAGTGTTILTGVSTYTGATQISAGALQVDGSITSTATVGNGATLQGSGTVGPVAVASGGMLAPGAGVGNAGHLSVTGNVGLAADSNLEIDTGAAGTDLLSATGAINLAGTVTFNPTSTAHYGDTAVFATANTITGSFASVPDTVAGVLYPSVSVSANGTGQQLTVTMKAASFLTQLTSPNPDVSTIATALDGARVAHYTDLKPLYDSVDSLTGTSLAAAFSGLAPNTARSLPSIATLQMGGFTNVIWNRLTSLGMGGQSSGASSFNIDTSALNLAQRDLTPFTDANAVLTFGKRAGAMAAAAPVAVTSAQADNGWTNVGKGVSGFLSGSSLDGTVAIGGGAGKAKTNGYLIAAGLDVQASSHLVIGGALSYADSTAKIATGPARIGSVTYQGLAYARYNGDGWFVNGFAGSGAQSITTDRTVTVGKTAYQLHGKTNGTSPTFGVFAGKPFVKSNITITPAVGLQWLNASVDAYSETGGLPAMTYGKVSRKSFTGRVGFDAVGNFMAGKVAIKPLVHAYLVHDFVTGGGAVTAAFTQTPATVMSFGLASKQRTWGELGIGAQAAINDNVSMSVRYDTTVGRSDLSSGAWTGQLNIKF